jgi:hypothetical protein
MRAAAVVVALLMLCACAEEKLTVNPPPGVDFSGQWKLNPADSDDPQALAQTANGTTTNNNNVPPQTGRGRGRGGGGGGGVPGANQGPSPPSIAVMGASLRWPGKGLEIKQVAGVVAFTSDGRNRVCQPGTERKHHPHHEDDSHDRDMPSGRDAPPPVCGWSERTLVVRGGDPDDDRPPYEEDYSLSEDGMHLVEAVVFTSGRSNGYTLSREWDRVQK